MYVYTRVLTINAVYLQFHMPVNLNALIRYKTIDECLSNSNLKCTIDLLIDKCSEKLIEYKGSESGVSERSIRNDIRILRSDILGFNAPIQCINGIYSYSEPNFSIYGRPINEKELLIEIQDLLVENFELLKRDNKNLNDLLFCLSKITNVKIPIKCCPSSSGNTIFPKKIDGYIKNKIDFKIELNGYVQKLNSPIQERFLGKFFSNKEAELFNWRFILEVLNSTSDF